MQRLVSYGVGIVAIFVVEMSSWQSATAMAIATFMFLAAFVRIATSRTAPPYLLAQSDLLLTGIAIAIVTTSLIITISVLSFITIAIAATFRASFGVAVTTSLATATPGIVTSILVSGQDADHASEYLALVIVIIVMLTLAVFILGLFSVQARQLRQRLNHQKMQLDAVLGVTPVVLAAVSTDRTITTLAGDLGSWKELSGQPLEDTSPIIQLVTETESGGRATREVAFGDRVFSVTCDPGIDGAALLTAYDVTEQTETRLRLEEVVRSKDQFIAAVSHELRTPLASVLGFSELVQEQMDKADPLQPMMTEVTDQSAEMAAIIDDLLVAARASFESVPMAPMHLDLTAEAQAVVDSMGSRLSVQPTCALGDVTAFADPIRVRQIIRNLLTNADRYGGEQVMVETCVADGTALLTVRDNGNPLPAERREQIFQPYESSGPVRGQPAAIGLGLAVSRTLAELMGGTVTYDHDGTWSVFELCLPVGVSRPLALMVGTK